MAPLSVGTANVFWHLPLSIGTANDFWRGGPRCHPALALPTISGAHAPDATQFWHCQRFRARFRLPWRLLAAPVPRTCRGTSRGGRPTSRNTSRGISRAPPPSPSVLSATRTVEEGPRGIFSNGGVSLSGLLMARTPRKPPRPGTANDFWRGGPRCHPVLALPTISGSIPSPLRPLLAAPVPRTCRGIPRGGRPTSRNTSRGISRAPPPSPLWRLTANMPQSPGLYSSPSPCSLLPSFSLPARLSASRKIHSTCAFALRMSSSAQRSTAAQIFGSMRRGYCLRRATNVCSCEC